jgi:hypothetical protein
VRLDAGELQQPAPGVEGAARLGLPQPGELGVAAGQAVLGDRVAPSDPVQQPLGELGAGGRERVQVGRGDDEQRHAVDAVVVEPVADERRAAERRGGHVVDRHRDGVGHAAAASLVRAWAVSAAR